VTELFQQNKKVAIFETQCIYSVGNLP